MSPALLANIQNDRQDSVKLKKIRHLARSNSWRNNVRMSLFFIFTVSLAFCSFATHLHRAQTL